MTSARAAARMEVTTCALNLDPKRRRSPHVNFDESATRSFTIQGLANKEGRLVDGLTADIKRLNRQTRPHTPGPARMECRRFHPGSSTKPWGVPQGQRGRNRGRNQTEDSNPSPSPRYIEFPGQSVIFPIAVAEVWEFDRSPSWRVFCYSAICNYSLGEGGQARDDAQEHA